MTSSSRAASATVVAKAPAVAVCEYLVPRRSGMRPKEGLWPTSPQKPAGVGGDPPPSLDGANAPSPPATAEAEPPLDPPGVTVVSQGLRVTPVTRLLVYAQK